MQRFLRLLGLLPAPLHRLALRVGHRLQFMVCRRFGIVMVGCAIICRNGSGEVLLARHCYFEPDCWSLPGGMLHVGEQPIASAVREVREEFSCRLEHVRFYEFEQATYWGCRYDTFMIEGEIKTEPLPDGREIAEARFFAIDDLPENLMDVARERIERWAEMSSETPRAAEHETGELPVRTVRAWRDSA